MNLSRIAYAALAAALTALPLAASAQTPPPAPAPSAAPHHAGWMHALRSLNLTPDQRTQIAAMVQQTRDANKNADPDTRKANSRKLRSDIRALLTPDQQAQLKAALKAQRKAA